MGVLFFCALRSNAQTARGSSLASDENRAYNLAAYKNEAKLSVTLHIDHNTYLHRESIRGRITVSNKTGTALRVRPPFAAGAGELMLLKRNGQPGQHPELPATDWIPVGFRESPILVAEQPVIREDTILMSPGETATQDFELPDPSCALDRARQTRALCSLPAEDGEFRLTFLYGSVEFRLVSPAILAVAYARSNAPIEVSTLSHDSNSRQVAKLARTVVAILLREEQGDIVVLAPACPEDHIERLNGAKILDTEISNWIGKEIRALTTPDRIGSIAVSVQPSGQIQLVYKTVDGPEQVRAFDSNGAPLDR